MILLDDLGFAQLGCYGSGVGTPHIDALAERGLRYNNFHVAAICSATSTFIWAPYPSMKTDSAATTPAPRVNS